MNKKQKEEKTKVTESMEERKNKRDIEKLRYKELRRNKKEENIK